MDKETKNYLKRVVKGSAEKISESAVYLGLFSDNWEKDPVPIMQLGLAMVMDKPIVMVALDDVPIPENIRKVAVAIERVRRDDKAGFERAVNKVMETVRKH